MEIPFRRFAEPNSRRCGTGTIGCCGVTRHSSTRHQPTEEPQGTRLFVLIYPAVDIQQGRVARGPAASPLADPLATVQRFLAEGAGWIHVVDLDRARQTGRENDEVVRAIAHEAAGQVQVGGLLGRAAQVRAALALGAARAVATAAIDPAELAEVVGEFGSERLALGIDARDGHLTSEAPGMLQRAATLGIDTVIYRDVGRDGALNGPDVEGARRLVGRCAKVVLAGGVGGLRDIADARAAGLDGLIIGRALLEGRFTLVEALSWAR
ncbi:MAG TPA: HisA/HisF-related TIM barrel protein [Gemmatimonadales bacterium]